MSFGLQIRKNRVCNALYNAERIYQLSIIHCQLNYGILKNLCICTEIFHFGFFFT